jgi:DNA helicase HerA-like ATPase
MTMEQEETGGARRVFDQVREEMLEDAALRGGAYTIPADRANAAGFTMFDTPNSDDNLIEVLVPKDRIERLPSQASVRIRSRDGRVYLGTVVRGPYALPDGLRADAPPVVATALHGSVFLPEYHGLVSVELAGEERDGALMPHRFRPLPNSPVEALEDAEIEAFWKTGGNVRLGAAFGHEDLAVSFDLMRKEVLPRHTAILGTTGGGKSTTVAGMVHKLQTAGAAVILLDTEGEYTEMNLPTEDPRMEAALERLGRKPEGVADTHVLYLVGRDAANPLHPDCRPFSPSFSRISPHAAMEIFDLNEAQEERFQKAVTTTARLLDELDLWTEENRQYAKEAMDEFDEGWPKMRLSQVYDVARCIADVLQHKEVQSGPLRSPDFERNRDAFKKVIEEAAKDETKRWDSWRKVQGRIGRIERLGLFDNPKATLLDARQMLQPGRVTIIDLSDSESTVVNNLVISELLREVQRQQEEAYQEAEDMGREPTPVVVMIEEAHEFLSSARIARMPILHQQVARIAKRGRKRWLGLVFITQLPQHLPDEMLGLVNNYILHKIGDTGVVSRLKRTIGGMDDSLWGRVSRLAPGQAIVSLSSLTRPLLTAIDPAPCRLRMIR